MKDWGRYQHLMSTKGVRAKKMREKQKIVPINLYQFYVYINLTKYVTKYIALYDQSVFLFLFP